MRAIATTVALCVLLVARSVAPQDLPSDPTEHPTEGASLPEADFGDGGVGSSGSQSSVDASISQMQFGLDESASGGSDGAGNGTDSPWIPVTTVTSGSLGLNWSWDGAFSEDGSNWVGDGEAGGPDIEVVLPGIDATLAASRRQKYFFDSKYGFAVYATEGEITPGKCTFAYCMHLVFESDYGAMTPFDAFVLDSYESASGPMNFSTSQWRDEAGMGPVPLVLGSMSKETLAKLGTNWESVLNWKDPRRTTWTLHPTTEQANEIDITLSLRQLYTYLPGYTGTSITGDGPFYSADLSDQVIIRVNAQIASAFAGSSAMLPTIVDHIGSQLVDISLTSSLLYKSNGVSGGNEMQLAFKLTRRKYGGALPWYPVTTSPECQRCNELPTSNEFLLCVDKNVDGVRGVIDATDVRGVRAVVEDLLSYQNERTSFDMKPVAEACFSQMLHNTTATAPGTSQFSGTEWVDITPAIVDPWHNLRDVDAMLRCWTDSRCNQASESIKADAQVVVLHHEPARTQIDFDNGRYTFSLQLALDDAPGTQTVTTQVLTSEMNTSALQTAIASVLPDSDKLALDIEVVKYDNEQEIESIERNNQYMMDDYNKALQALAAAGASANPAQPQPPTPQPVPSPVFTLEIIFHNLTVVPSVVAVNDGNGQWPHNTTDSVLRFQVADLDVDKFTYVPPPAGVDFTWSDEPAWKTHVLQFLPQFDATDSCGQCRPQLEACLFDEDCAYGVNKYLAGALSFSRLIKTVTTSDFDQTDGKWTSNNLDVTDTLRQGRLFFPADGFAKLEAFFQCLSIKQCNVGQHRDQASNSVPTQGVVVPPTLMLYRGAETEILVALDEAIQVSKGAKVSSYTHDGDALRLQQFLLDTVLQWEPHHVRNVLVTSPQESASGDPLPNGVVRYVVSWNSLVPPLTITTTHATSQVTSRDGRLELRTSRKKVEASFQMPFLEWSRLQVWLGIFVHVPFGTTIGGGPTITPPTDSGNVANDGSSSNVPPGSSIGAGTTTAPPTDSGNVANNGSASNDTTIKQPPVPTICAQCSRLLTDCTGDTACRQAASVVLATLLPDMNIPPTLSYNQYEMMWNPFSRLIESPVMDSITQANVDQVMGILGCVSQNICAVGYGTATSSADLVVPTTVFFQAIREVVIPTNSSFKLQFKQSSWILNTASDLKAVDGSIYELYNEYVAIEQGYSPVASMHTFRIFGSHAALSQLYVMDVYPPGLVSKVGYFVSFVSSAPAVPSWIGLLTWFGQEQLVSPTINANDELCSTCLPKFQACFSDHECWRSVQEVVVPMLQSTQEEIPLKMGAVGMHYVYSAQFTSMLQSHITNSPNRSSFTTTESWRAFRDILQCVWVSSCDVETIEDAALPPATAHIPSYLKFRPGRIEFVLYVGALVEGKLNGSPIKYTENGTGSTTDLDAFLGIVFGTTSPPFETTVSQVQGQDAWLYAVTFVDDVFVSFPQIFVLGNGQAPAGRSSSITLKPWELTIQSVNQYPEWDKLLSLLTLTPPTGLGMSSTSLSTNQPTSSYVESCTSTEMYKRSCYEDYVCWYLLNAYAIPTMARTVETNPADFNTVTNMFEIDMTATLVSQVMWKKGANDTSKTTLVRLIYESTLCATGSTKPVFQNPRIKFSRPAQGPLQLEYQGDTFTVHDEDAQADGKLIFQHSFNENVIARAGGSSGPTLTWWKNSEMIHYDIELTGFYASGLPHLVWIDPVTGTRSESQDSPWRLSFHSPISTIANDAYGWLTWLGTQPTM